MADRQHRKGVSSIWQKLAMIGIPVCAVLMLLFAFLYLFEARRSDHFAHELTQCRSNLNQCYENSNTLERAAARYERAQRVLAFYDASTWMYKSVQLEWTPGYWTTLGACGASACYEVRLTDFKSEKNQAPMLYFRLSNAKADAASPATPSTEKPQSDESKPADPPAATYQPTVNQEFALPLELGCRISVHTLDHEFLFVIEDARENSSFLGIGVRIGGEKDVVGAPVYTCPSRESKLTSDLFKTPASAKP